MTVRFKSQSEYQKSYGTSRSRSISPQRRLPLSGLRSDPKEISRQWLKRLGPVGAAPSSSSLLGSPEHPGAPVPRRPPSAGRKDSPASRSCSALKNPPSPESKQPKVSGSAPEPRAGPTADLEPLPIPESGSPLRPNIDGKSVTLRPSDPEPSRILAATEPQEPSDRQVNQALRWEARMRPGGQRSGGHRSEYHRQFSWKKPVKAASPLLTAEQVLHSSSRSVPPFKKNTVSMETEYRRSFQGLFPPSGPRLRRHLERQMAPVFHTYTSHRRKSLEPQKKVPLKLATNQRANRSQSPPQTTPPPAQVQRRLRNLEEGGATDDITEQVKELRQQALAYRNRAWGTNFSRNHLSQLLSDYNALWEPTDSHTEPSTPRLNIRVSPEPDSRSASCIEALDLASNSSTRSSVGGEETRSKETLRSKGTESPPGPDAGPQTAWEEEEEEEEEEGRLPTPRRKTRPIQRTHHDLTTPATGGAILVGKMTNVEDSSPSKQKQKWGAAVSAVSGSDYEANKPTKLKEAWSENTPKSLSPFPPHKQTPSPQPKPLRMKQTSLDPEAPPPQHGIQGTLRHPDFQHNGELGLKFRELPCSRGGCGSDEDDRLSVMSWRSAASCSAASAILERAQKRREDFWGKR